MDFEIPIDPYTDPLLLNKNQSVSQSPFTIVFDRIGIAFAASTQREKHSTCCIHSRIRCR
jgi:hypothetical protein